MKTTNVTIPTRDAGPFACVVAVIDEGRSLATIARIDYIEDLGGHPECLEDYMSETFGDCTWMVVEHATVFGKRVA